MTLMNNKTYQKLDKIVLTESQLIGSITKI